MALITDLALGFAIGSRQALKQILAWLSMPKVAGVAIQTTSYRESCNSDVSSMPIIAPATVGESQQGKVYLTDNAAPKPRQWDIQGYIGAIYGEPSSLAMVLQPSLLNQQEKLKKAWLNRTPVDFLPLNSGTSFGSMNSKLQVAIKSLVFDTRPEVTNKIPVTLSLVEVPYIKITDGKMSIAGTGSNVVGQAQDMGSQPATQVLP